MTGNTSEEVNLWSLNTAVKSPSSSTHDAGDRNKTETPQERQRVKTGVACSYNSAHWEATKLCRRRAAGRKKDRHTPVSSIPDHPAYGKLVTPWKYVHQQCPTKANIKGKVQGFYICKMTIAMAGKLVTSFRFTEENKANEGLNSVFTDFIICRLTETGNHRLWVNAGVRSLKYLYTL